MGRRRDRLGIDRGGRGLHGGTLGARISRARRYRRLRLLQARGRDGDLFRAGAFGVAARRRRGPSGRSALHEHSRGQQRPRPRPGSRERKTDARGPAGSRRRASGVRADARTGVRGAVSVVAWRRAEPRGTPPMAQSAARDRAALRGPPARRRTGAEPRARGDRAPSRRVRVAVRGGNFGARRAGNAMSTTSGSAASVIEAVRLLPYRLPLRDPWPTAEGPVAEREGVIVALLDSEGRVGLGDAAPLPGFGLETIGS